MNLNPETIVYDNMYNENTDGNILYTKPVLFEPLNSQSHYVQCDKLYLFGPYLE